MTILSAQAIERTALTHPGFIEPFFCAQHTANGMTYGLGPHGYDIRIHNDIRLWWGVTKLAVSTERFRLPNNIRGITLNKSSWRRQGLEVGAATILEAGWEGYLTLELTLLRPLTLFIPAGSPIAQIEFAYLDQPTSRPYRGRYQNQSQTPTPHMQAPTQ